MQRNRAESPDEFSAPKRPEWVRNLALDKYLSHEDYLKCFELAHEFSVYTHHPHWIYQRSNIEPCLYFIKSDSFKGAQFPKRRCEASKRFQWKTYGQRCGVPKSRPRVVYLSAGCVRSKVSTTPRSKSQSKPRSGRGSTGQRKVKSGRKSAAQLSNATSSAFDEGLTPHSRVVVPRFTESNERTARQLLSLDPSNRSASAAPTTRSDHTMTQPAPPSHSSHASISSQAHLVVKPILLPNAVSSPNAAAAPPSTPGSTGDGTNSPDNRPAAGEGGNVPATPQSTARATSYNKDNVECRAHIVRLLDQSKIEQQWTAFVEHKLGHGTMAAAVAKCDPGTPRVPGSGRRRRTASTKAKRGRKPGSNKRGKRRGGCGESPGDRVVTEGDGDGVCGGDDDDEEQPAASRVSEELERLSQEFGQTLSKLRASDWHYLQTGSLTLMHITGQVDGAAPAADDSASVQQPAPGSSESLSPDSTAGARDSCVPVATSSSAGASSHALKRTLLPTMYGMFPRDSPHPLQHRTQDSNLYNAEQHQHSSSQPQLQRRHYPGGQAGGASASSFQDTRRQRSGVDMDQAMRLANQDLYDPMHHQGDTGGFQLTQSTIQSSQGSVDTPAVAVAVLQGASIPQRGHTHGSHHHTTASRSGGFGRAGRSQGLYGNQVEENRQFQYLARSGSLVQELTNFAPGGQGGAPDGVSFSQQSGHSLTRTSSLVSSLGGADDTGVDPELGRTASTMHHMPAPTRHGSLHSWRQAPLTSNLNDDSRQAPTTAEELEVDPTSEVQRTTAMPVPQFRGVSRAAVMTQWANDDDHTDSAIVNHHDMEPSLAADLSPHTTISTSGAGGPFHYESIVPGDAGNLEWNNDSATMLQSHQLKAASSAGATTGTRSTTHPRSSGARSTGHTDHRGGASTRTEAPTEGASGRQVQPFTTPQVGSTVPRTQAGYTRAHGPRSAGAVQRSTARYSAHHKADMLSPALTTAEPDNQFGQYTGTQGQSASTVVRGGRLSFSQLPHAADGAPVSSGKLSHDNRSAGHDQEHEGVDLREDQESLYNMSDSALSFSSFGLANRDFDSFDRSDGGRHGTFEQPSAEGTGGTLTASGSHAPSPSKRARGKKKPADAARLGGSGGSHFSAGDENMPPAHYTSERGDSLSTAALQSLLSDAHTGGTGGQPWRARDAAPSTSPREAVDGRRRSFVLGTKNALQFTIQPAAAASGSATTRAGSGRPQSGGLRASVVVKSGGNLRAEHVLLTDSQRESCSLSGQSPTGHTGGQEDVEEIDVLHDSIYAMGEVKETASRSRQSHQTSTARPHGSSASSMQAATPVVHTASTSLRDMASAALAVAGTSPGSTVVFSPISPLASKQIEKQSRNSDPNASLQEMFGSPALRPNSDEQQASGITPPGGSCVDKRRLTQLLGSGDTNTSSSSEHSHFAGLRTSTPLQLGGVAVRTPGSAFGGPPSSGGSEPFANPPHSGMATSSSGRRRKRSDSSGMYTLGDFPAVPAELRADGGVAGAEELVVYQDGNSPRTCRGDGTSTGTGTGIGTGAAQPGNTSAAQGLTRSGSSRGQSSSTRTEQQIQSENRVAGGPGRLQLQSPLVGRPVRRVRKVAGLRARVRDGGGQGSGEGQDQSRQQDVARFFGEQT